MYKRICNFILLLLCFPLFLTAKELPAKLFELGNQHYAKGQYPEAVKSYMQLVDSGYNAAEVYFNLGNAYYKLDDISLAILYYEKAYKLTPGDEDIKVNLQFANQKITDKIEAVPQFFLMQWWQKFVMSFSYNYWALIGVLSLLLGFSGLVIYLFTYVVQLKKTAFYSGLVLVSLGFFFLFIANTQLNYFDSYNQAIVFSGSVDVKSGPQNNMKTLFVIHEGLKVTIKDRHDGWAKIELPNGNVGWIELVNIREI